MDKFWSRFVSFIFLYNFWINTIFAEGQCQHPCKACIEEEICNFISIQDTCYYVYKDGLRNWEESKQHCQEEGLEMIEIDNANINNITKKLLDGLPAWLKIDRTKAWLGGRAHNYANWSFVNGVGIKGEQFGDIEFRNPGGHYWAYCGNFFPAPASSSPFFISVQSCHTKGNFLCRKRRCTSPAKRKCLIFIDEQKNWFEARSHCMDIGGDLFYLEADEHISQFNLGGNSSLLGEVSYVSSNTYIGIVHRQWEWYDTSKIIYTNWADREPNAFWQECLMMYGDTGKWDDNVCDAQLLTLCQGETTESTSTSPTTLIHSDQDANRSNQSGMTPPIEAAPSESTISLGKSTTPPSNGKLNGTSSENDFTVHGQNTNKNAIILGSFLGFAVLLIIVIIVTVYVCWRRGKNQTPNTENNLSAGNHEVPEEQAPTTDVYDYINNDEIPEKVPATTARYQNVSDLEISDQSLHPPTDGTQPNGTPQDVTAEKGNYQHLLKRNYQHLIKR